MSAEIDVEYCRGLAGKCRTEASKRLVGQEKLVQDILNAFISGGHILVEGVPGLAKTLAVRTFADMLGLEFRRIQFTPDLLPADVTGTLIYEQNSGKFSVRKGPVFSDVVLADEINRAPAKVQSAMLEAMEERQVTIGDETLRLPENFFVLATQNPVEQEGTYPLPEAELDRFLVKLLVKYPSAAEELAIVRTAGNAPSVPVKKVISTSDIKKLREASENVICDDRLIEYIVSILEVTRPGNSRGKPGAAQNSNDITGYITFGASPRAGIAMLRCARTAALFEGRTFVLPEDIKSVAANVLRHRIVLSYEASADNVSADDIISKILDFVPVP